MTRRNEQILLHGKCEALNLVHNMINNHMRILKREHLAWPGDWLGRENRRHWELAAQMDILNTLSFQIEAERVMADTRKAGPPPEL